MGGELRNLCIHLNTGKKNGECQYEEVKCKHEKCCEMHLHLHLHHHEDNECSERLILCEYCNKEDTFRFITEEHYNECLQYPVSCPNKCACMQMTRANLIDHVNNVSVVLAGLVAMRGHFVKMLHSTLSILNT